MQFLADMKVRTKLGVGFGIVCLVLATAVLLTMSRVDDSGALTDRVIELRAPTAKLGVELQNGLNASLANLRGYMLLGKAQFESGRVANWRGGINPALAQMTELSKNWTVEANKQKLATMEQNFAKLHQAQDEIAAISGTTENLPATKMLIEDAAPQAAIMAAEITAMIDAEKTLASSRERKALLGMMADVRGTLGLGLASIRAYLLTGEGQFKKQFEVLWHKNTRRFGDLQKSKALLSSGQSASFDRFAAARDIFDPLPPKMFAIRGGEQWNIANRWLATKAAPVAAEINTTLKGMIENQQRLMNADAETARNSITALISLLWTLLALGIAFSILVAIVVTRSIARPVGRITQVAQQFSQGDLSQNLDIEQKDEIGQLADAFRRMGEALRSKAEAATQIAQGNLAVELEAASKEDVLGHSMIDMVDSLKTMNAEIGGLVDAAVAGRLDTRGNVAKFEGDYAQIIEGVNETLNAVVSPINEAARVLDLVAKRDLRPRVQGDYQGDHARIKEALNTAVQNLDEGMGQVGSATGQVGAASSQISSGSQSLAEGASEQAASLEEISSSLEEMASMTRQNAENSNQARTLSQSSRESADKGQTSMARMTETIDKIKTSSDETAKIVGTIDEIAFQTNLLALNAAVEAARAGEAGKGFAVVAEEVRNLAQRSAAAAKNTADMIEESVKNANEGVVVTEEVAAVLGEIAQGARKVNDLVGEIASASSEQTQGIEQVNESVAQLDKVTQQNAANAEESASAAEELNAQAAELKGLVDQFDLNNDMPLASLPKSDNGGKTFAAPAVAAPLVAPVAGKPANCWQFKKCGRQAGGDKVAELGVCPAAVDAPSDGINRGANGGRICWDVTGTLCGGKAQGTFADKRLSCMTCEFFKQVKSDEGPIFMLHQSNGGVAAPIAPDKLIPLDDDTDFAEF